MSNEKKNKTMFLFCMFALVVAVALAELCFVVVQHGVIVKQRDMIETRDCMITWQDSLIQQHYADIEALTVQLDGIGND